MTSPTAQVLQAARDALADPRRFFQEELTGTGRKTYRLGYTNIDPEGLTVTVAANAALVGEAAAVEVIDGEEGYLRFTVVTPAPGSIIRVEGWYWDWFSDATLKRYIGYAVTNYQTAEGEDRYAELLTDNADFGTVLGYAGAVEALWAEWVRSARMIDVSSPEVSIPARQRFQQLQTMLGQVMGRLRDAETALNIGRYKIEMVTLRRVSRTTGRLVPIFKPQEWDDFQPWPERILPPIDDGIVGL